jgi:selenocysteine lyase/cysteine desulfurase
MPFDISKAREHFPALKQDQVFLDNAGGSQALGEVIDSYERALLYNAKQSDEFVAWSHTSAKRMSS